MNSGPEIVSDVDTVEPDGTEVTTIIHRHWGCEWSPGNVRWDPGYGSGVYVPYDEAEARADVAHTPGSRLVTRYETTVMRTTPWKVVSEPDTSEVERTLEERTPVAGGFDY